MLTDIPNVEERKMFGSICFMVNGKLAVCVGDHDGYQLLIRTDPDRAAELLEYEGADWARMGGRKMNGGWITVAASALETDDTLRFWVLEALDFNSSV